MDIFENLYEIHKNSKYNIPFPKIKSSGEFEIDNNYLFSELCTKNLENFIQTKMFSKVPNNLPI